MVTSLSRAASRCDHVPPGKHWPHGLTRAPLTPLQPCAVTVVTHLRSHPIRCRARVAVLRPCTLSLSVLFRTRSTGLGGARLLWGWRNCRETNSHTTYRRCRVLPPLTLGAQWSDELLLSTLKKPVKMLAAPTPSSDLVKSTLATLS